MAGGDEGTSRTTSGTTTHTSEEMLCAASNRSDRRTHASTACTRLSILLYEYEFGPDNAGLMTGGEPTGEEEGLSG